MLLTRPLLAVILGIVAASTETHLLAWHYEEPGHVFELQNYLLAAPWRALLAAVVLAVDVVLGLRWLHGGTIRIKRSKQSPISEPSPLVEEGRVRGSTTTDIPTTIESFNATLIPSLLAKRDRFAMLGRLMWQHWRQSWSLMLIVAGLFILTTLMSLGGFGAAFWKLVISQRNLGPQSDPTYVPMALFAALMGCCVFLADQSRRQFRFFIEHNVPPRYVWFTRQLPWLIVLTVITLLVCSAWLRVGSNIGQLWEMVQTSMQQGWISFDRYGHNSLYMPPVILGLVCSFVAYAAGQFASMLIRSGILAAVAGVLLAALLCFWVLLMHGLRVPFWWSVWPIPLVLLWATWLRAPDWIRENTRWRARLRLSVSVLVPFALLFATMALYRVHQAPVTFPRFDVAEYQSQIAEGLTTAELYNQAIKKSAGIFEELQDNAGRLKILGQLSPDILKLVAQANQQPICHFFDPAHDKSFNFALAENLDLLTEALFASGRRLQAEGKLDAALDRYVEALQLLNRNTAPEVWTGLGFRSPRQELNSFCGYFTQWAAEKGQTAERVRGAIQRLQAITPSDLHLDDAIKDEYIIARRVIQGDESANTLFYSKYNQPTTADFLLTMLMPWERSRADRVLNVLTNAELGLMRRVLGALDGQMTDGANSDHDLSFTMACLRMSGQWALRVLEPKIYVSGLPEKMKFNLVELVETTIPNLWETSEVASRAIYDSVEFEAWRRATMLVLAIQAYRLEHGQLPESLHDLVGSYFEKLPPDPYSGLEFRYFPHGLPIAATDDIPNRPYLWNSDFVPGAPGVWCTSPDVNASIEKVDTSNDSEAALKLKDIVVYSRYGWYGTDNNVDIPFTPPDSPWPHGYWFPIPAAP